MNEIRGEKLQRIALEPSKNATLTREWGEGAGEEETTREETRASGVAIFF